MNPNISKNDYNDYISDRGGFFQVANEIWEAEVEPYARLVWLYVFSQKPTWQSSMSNIVRNTGMSKDTVKKHLVALEEAKMIVVDRSSPHGWKFYFPPVNSWADQGGNVESRLNKKMQKGGGAKFDTGVLKFRPHSRLASSGISSANPEELLSAPGSISNLSGSTSTISPAGSTSSKEVVEAYIASIGSIDALKDRRSRQDNLTGLVQQFQQLGYTEKQVLDLSKVVAEYAVPRESAVTNKKANREWREDFTWQWSVIVKSEFKPVQPQVHDKIEMQTNPDALSVDIGEFV